MEREPKMGRAHAVYLEKKDGGVKNSNILTKEKEKEICLACVTDYKVRTTG